MSGFDDGLRQDLSDIADRATPSPTAWEAIQTRIVEQAEPEMEVIMLDKAPPPTPRSRLWILSAAAVLLLVGGITLLARSDDDPATILANSPNPSEDVVDADGVVPGGEPTLVAEPDPEAEAAIAGIWLSPRGGVWRFSDGVIAVNGVYTDEFTYVARDTTIELIDEVCRADVPGTYEWAIAGDVLALTVVSDECSWRERDLDGVTFHRAEPDQQSAEDLVGVWLSSQGGAQSGVWTLGDDGEIVIKGRGADQFTYAATDATIELIDEDCGPDLPDIYEWVIAGDVFGLTVVRDECGVGNELDGVTFQRVKLAEQRAEDLLGVWESTRETVGTWSIEERAISVTGGDISGASYTATDTTIELKDAECGVARPGIYEWVIAGDVLALTLVSDECNRSDSLDGSRFHRAN